MNRSDKVFIAIVIVVAIGLFLSTSQIAQAVQSDTAQAVVVYHDHEVLRVNMNHNDTYTVQGDMGAVVIEVLDGKVRVADEISPLHYCSNQGWVSKTNIPIVCLPNGIVIKIEAQELNNAEGDIIVR